jgi:hypothetical protein
MPDWFSSDITLVHSVVLCFVAAGAEDTAGHVRP